MATGPILAGRGRGGIVAALIALAGAGWSAHAGLQDPVAAPPVPAPTPVVTGYETQDHFPGALRLYLDAPQVAPTRGTTGTVALPAEPTGATDATVRAAQPWLARGSAQDRGRALQCLTTAIYYEAASEPDAGQSAVAQVILNRARHPTFPGTVCGVVYQGSDHSGCQFSFACDGALARLPMRSAWLRAGRAAARALAGYVFAPVGLATHYHTFAVTPAWNRSLVMTGVFGAHFFHRWKGWWGTPAAFTRSYAGAEPVPGPHVAPPIVADMKAGPVPLTIPAPSRPIAGGTVQDRFAAAPATPESQILDKWKDSGKPLF